MPSLLPRTQGNEDAFWEVHKDCTLPYVISTTDKKFVSTTRFDRCVLGDRVWLAQRYGKTVGTDSPECWLWYFSLG